LEKDNAQVAIQAEKFLKSDNQSLLADTPYFYAHKKMKDLKKIATSALIIKSGIASIDQAVLSAVNFITSIILIRYASKIEYGSFSIAFSILLIFISIQAAIVNAPLAVLLVTKSGREKNRYAGSLCYGQFLGVIPAVCLAVTCIAFLHFWGLDTNRAWIAVAVSIAVIGLLFREFLRAYYFAQEIPLKVLKMDALYAISYLILIFVIGFVCEIKTIAIFLLMGLCALFISLLFSRTLDWRFELHHIKKSYKENWKYGKWALLGVLITHTQNYSYLYFLGAMLGSAAVAEVSASRLLMMPLALVEMGWSKIVIPHGAKLREQNQFRTLFRNQILASIGFTVGIVFYVMMLLLFFDILENVIITQKYSNSRNFILLWGAIFTARYITLNASYGLQVLKSFDTISKANFFTMLVTVSCAFLFISRYGIKGGLTALIIGATLLAIALWYYFCKNIFRKVKDQRTANLISNLSLNTPRSED
jgi:O-antigen/teichoic acid export membrane protein